MSGYIPVLKRRRLHLTDYRQRKALFLSGKPRFVVRFSLRYCYAYFVDEKREGDYTIAGANLKELMRDFEWLGGNNTPGAYLVGLLAGFKGKAAGVKEAVLDIGLARSVRGSRIYACVMGARDAGVDIPVGEEVLPSEDRVRGEHIASYARTLREQNPELFSKHFSEYLRRGLDPEKLPEHFEEVKSKILAKYGGG